MKLKIIFLLTLFCVAANAPILFSNTLSTKDPNIFSEEKNQKPSEIIRIKPPLQNTTPHAIIPSIEIQPQIILPTPWYNNNLTKE